MCIEPAPDMRPWSRRASDKGLTLLEVEVELTLALPAGLDEDSESEAPAAAAQRGDTYEGSLRGSDCVARIDPGKEPPERFALARYVENRATIWSPPRPPSLEEQPGSVPCRRPMTAVSPSTVAGMDSRARTEGRRVRPAVRTRIPAAAIGLTSTALMRATSPPLSASYHNSAATQLPPV